MTSNYEKVCEFNTAFDVKTAEYFDFNVFKSDPKLIQYRLSLITEEYNELLDAVKNHDYTETVDALTDILYVVYGMFTSIGCDADKAFDLVHNNNMTKLCDNENDAIETVEYYKLHPELGYDTPDYKLSPDNKHYVVYNQSTKKILKSIKWKNVDLSKLWEN